MNDSIRHLSQIAAKEQKLILGLMSGTSLDGLDIALCRISDTGENTEVQLQEFKTISYPQELMQKLRKIVSVETVTLQDICLIHSRMGDYHADLILQALKEWHVEPGQIDCIASHGQTIYHAPATHHQGENMQNATLQIVDGDHIARKTGILTVSDFRQKHTAAGGEGAPMAALTDTMLYKDETESRLLLNIGGIANFTYLPAAKLKTEVITTDTGPGNTLIDQAMQNFFNQPYDKDGMVASRGTVHVGLLNQMLQDPFFSLPLPRTTGPELFNLEWVKKNQQIAGADNISNDDLIATLTWFSAQTIADTIKNICKGSLPEVYLSGGGIHNTQLINWIEELLEQPTHSFEEIGFNPDAKEAVCFAVLANEALSGEAFTINTKQNAGRNVNFGKISLPV